MSDKTGKFIWYLLMIGIFILICIWATKTGPNTDPNIIELKTYHSDGSQPGYYYGY